MSHCVPRRIGDLLADSANRFPDREAAVFGDRRIGYRELDTAVGRCARALLAAGIGRGDRVAMLTTPRPEFLIVFLATLRVGAIWVGLNPVHQPAELGYVLGDCRPRLLFGFARLRGRDNRPVLRDLPRAAPAIAKLVMFGEPEGLGQPYADFVAAGDSVPESALEARIGRVRPDDVAMIVHTSGSTGHPKGAMITQRNLAHCAEVQRWLFPIAPLRILCNLPVDHTVCTCDVIAYALACSGTVVFQERFRPEDVLAAVARERITCLIQISAMLQRILAHPARRQFDTSSLQATFFLGAPLPLALITELKTLGGMVVTGWGLTEATSSVTYTAAGDGLDVLAETVGRVAPGSEIRIADEGGRALEAGRTGEILVRGACVMAGYLDRPDATKAAIGTEGWLRSGDLGSIDSAGRLRLVGRIKDMFKSGGYSIYPREIENVLESHPAVALAVVVAIPDPLFYEVGIAFLVPRSGRTATRDEIERHCRARLANYKIPKRFVIRDALPALANGKFDKVALRAEALDLGKAGQG
jgi:acyl-CoA synthetase (AMP-forming)/AMP-acid ligase II